MSTTQPQASAVAGGTTERRLLLGAEEINKWHRAAMRALGDNEIRRKWGDTKPGGPVTVMLLCEDVARLQIERAEMLAALKESEAEITQITKDMIGARADNTNGVADSRFDEVSQQELARLEAMLVRIRAAISKAEARS